MNKYLDPEYQNWEASWNFHDNVSFDQYDTGIKGYILISGFILSTNEYGIRLVPNEACDPVSWRHPTFAYHQGKLNLCVPTDVPDGLVELLYEWLELNNHVLPLLQQGEYIPDGVVKPVRIEELLQEMGNLYPHDTNIPKTVIWIGEPNTLGNSDHSRGGDRHSKTTGRVKISNDGSSKVFNAKKPSKKTYFSVDLNSLGRVQYNDDINWSYFKGKDIRDIEEWLKINHHIIYSYQSKGKLEIEYTDGSKKELPLTHRTIKQHLTPL